MKIVFSIIMSLCIAMGALYALSLAIDAARLIKDRFHGPYIELPAKTDDASAIDASGLQQASALSAESEPSLIDHIRSLGVALGPFNVSVERNRDLQ